MKRAISVTLETDDLTWLKDVAREWQFLCIADLLGREGRARASRVAR